MKRRNFLASLFALPFVAKPLEALAPNPAKRSPEEWRQFIESEVAKRMQELNTSIFDSHKRAIESNHEAILRNTEAMLANAPAGFKIDHYPYDERTIRQLRDGLRRYKKPPEKK